MAARASDTGNRIIIVKGRHMIVRGGNLKSVGSTTGPVHYCTGAPLQGGEDLQPHPRLQLLQLPNPSTGM